MERGRLSVGTSIIVMINVFQSQSSFVTVTFLPFLSKHYRKAEMELKRKQEEEDRKKREEEEKVMQVWTTLKCFHFVFKL